MKQRILQVLYGISVVCLTLGDVAHYFAPDYGNYYQHYHNQPGQQSFQAPLSSIYQAPAPVYPSAAAPVAPVTPSTTTEFTLPEIVENRNAKNHFKFIPLNSQYLPPEERPNYDSPNQPAQGSNDFGYHYPRPFTTTRSTTASTATTTTERARPIVVQDPGELPTDGNDAFNQRPQGYDYNAPASVRPTTLAPAYLPPETLKAELPDSVNPLRLRVKEMRCLNHQGGYLRSVFKLDSFIGAVPSVDNDSYDKRCELRLSRSYVIVDIGVDDFQRCGVHECGRDLCLRLRFPAIRGMRTSADAIVTLHCKTQERVAVKTHALKMGVANDVQARSIGTHAHGGAQNAFRTHVELLRRGNIGYSRQLDPHEAVQLGEELLLRAHVLAGDGWNHTKLTDVNLQRISASGEILNNAPLISARGCLNPAMQSVCAHTPIFDAPLGHKLAFRAVMFQGMRSGEEIIISLRITGCLEQQDCQLSTQDCGGGLRRRRKRDTAIGTEMSEVSQVSFRVVMPDEELPVVENTPSENIPVRSRALILGVSLGFVLFFMSLAIFATIKLRK